MVSTKTYPLSIIGYSLRTIILMFPSPPNSTSLRNFSFSSQRMILYCDYKTYTNDIVQLNQQRNNHTFKSSLP